MKMNGSACLLLVGMVFGVGACSDDDTGETKDTGGGETEVDADQDGSYAGEDCDDSDASVHPGAEETCNGVDDDCDGDVDDEDDDVVGATTWLADADGDGYGDETATTEACDQPSGYVAEGEGGDCDDDDADVHPGAEETCNGVDDDCDDAVDDEDDDVAGASTWYADGDGDGYGDETATTEACDQPTGYVAEGTDCDDADSDIHPDASEICRNGVDENCDGADGNCLQGEFNTEDAGAILAGETEGDYTGEALSLAGDVDGDGLSDLVVAASLQGDGAKGGGAVYVVYGAVTGDVSLADADATLVGQNREEHAGSTLATKGDLDGDGYADLVIGAPESDVVGSYGGYTRIFLGPVEGEYSLDEADATVAPEGGGDMSSYSLASGGDADGDGVDDLLVGAKWVDVDGESMAGAVYLVTADPTGELDLSDAAARLGGGAYEEQVGWSVDGGDLNGDGLSDVAAGAVAEGTAGSYAGAVYVALAPLSGEIALAESADALVAGEAAYDFAGTDVSAGGDVDGDGYTDLLVGAYGETTGGDFAGASYLVFGPVTEDLSLGETDLKLVGEDADDDSGSAMDIGGDLDGDGMCEIVVASPDATVTDRLSGAVYVVYGATDLGGELDLEDAAARISGTSRQARAGTSVSSAGDVDGDGVDDLLVGAPKEQVSGLAVGTASLFYGASR